MGNERENEADLRGQNDGNTDGAKVQQKKPAIRILGIALILVILAFLIVYGFSGSVDDQQSSDSSNDVDPVAQDTEDDMGELLSSYDTGISGSEDYVDFMVGNITCIRGNDSDALSDTIDLIGLQTGVSEDSLPVNLSKLVLTVDDGSRSNTLTYAGSSELSDLFDDSTTVFIAEAIRDEDNSFTTTSPVMNKGDLILIYVSTLSDTNLTSVFESGDLDEDPEASGLFIDPKTIVSVTFTYETEALVSYSFKIPASYGDDKQISLG